MSHVIGYNFPFLSPIRDSSEIHQYLHCVSEDFYKILIRSPKFGLSFSLSTQNEQMLVHLLLSVNMLMAGPWCKPTGVTLCEAKTPQYQPLFPCLCFRTQSLYWSRKERIFCHANWNGVFAFCLPLLVFHVCALFYHRTYGECCPGSIQQRWTFQPGSLRSSKKQPYSMPLWFATSSR